ncbi:MAG TPA: arginine deiminase-related protein [Gammaproteobacteria bacterium]|nr:arginine deiminase-related protein [Gammaproteobacteria bacterium]
MNASQENQSATAVLMIRPANFGANPETAGSNTFQKSTAQGAEVQAKARAEFDGLVEVLSKAGVLVEVFEDRTEPVTPDAVFPNNWVSFHGDGSAWLYPMQAASRRWERRSDILDSLRVERGYRLGDVRDLSYAELDGRYLEGTGSLVLDRRNRVAYAGLSPRTDARLVQEWTKSTGYTALAFHARDTKGRAIYHTNVMLCVGTDFALGCFDCIVEPKERERVTKQLADTGHELVAISPYQMEAFAGNMLELKGRYGETLLALSARAERALQPKQRAVLERYARLVASPIDTIEDCSGGSVRCMLAEIHLPRNQ